MLAFLHRVIILSSNPVTGRCSILYSNHVECPATALHRWAGSTRQPVRRLRHAPSSRRKKRSTAVRRRRYFTFLVALVFCMTLPSVITALIQHGGFADGTSR